MIVLETTKSVVDRALDVSIDEDVIARWAREFDTSQLRLHGENLLAYLPSRLNQLANLVLLIDALNFCFWSDDPIHIKWGSKTYHRFNAMLVSIIQAVKYKPQWCDANYWLEATTEDIRELLVKTGTLLMMEEREEVIRETGRTLLDRFDGQFLAAIDSVHNQAWPMAVLLMTNFDSFRDVSEYDRQPVYFMKRAQICAMDLAIAFGIHDHPPLAGLEQLTAFADYRVPQALRNLGIMRLSGELSQKIEADEELPKDSKYEVEIRAGTIQAVDRMVKALNSIGKRAEPWQMDVYLWEMSHAPGVTVKHHRTRTVYY